MINEDGEIVTLLPGEAGLIKIGIFQQDVIADPGTVCPTPSPVWCRAYNAAIDTALWFRMPCKRWACPVCGAQKARMLSWRGGWGAEELASQGRPLTFITVTSHERLGPAQSLAVLPKAWNKLNRRLTRQTAGLGLYYAVPEQHQDGRWHMHSIVSAKVEERWLKDNARACGLGYQADSEEIKRAKTVTNYIAKYQAKLLLNQLLPSHFRRVRCSHKWPHLPEMMTPIGWEFQAFPSLEEANEAKWGDRGGECSIETDHKTSWAIIGKLDKV